MEKGFSAKLQDILQDLEDRDARDAARSVAPLRQEADAELLETSHLTIVQAVNQVLDWSGTRRLNPTVNGLSRCLSGAWAGFFYFLTLTS